MSSLTEKLSPLPFSCLSMFLPVSPLISNSLQTIFTKHFARDAIFSYKRKNDLKKLAGIKLLKTKQSPTGLSLKIIPLASPYYKKCPPILILLRCPTRNELPPHPATHKPLWETLVIKVYPLAKNMLIFFTRKILLSKSTSSSIESVIPSTSKSNFQVINQCKFHLQLHSLLLYHFLYFSLYVHICYVNFD